MQRYKVQNNLKTLEQIDNIIAIGSAKGGVGKSTITANLAVNLAAMGLAVGVLDADIYGPSQGLLFGVNNKVESYDNQTMQPLYAHGVHFISMSALADKEDPMIWRGPLASRVLVQLLHETNWPKLDILLVDLPPGTGDIQLSLTQKFPLAAAVVVTTPQEIALMDAKRGVAMFAQLNIAVLGVIENMSMHRCSKCGFEEAIFGTNRAGSLKQRLGAPLLGSLDLNILLRRASDQGRPICSHKERDKEQNQALVQQFQQLSDEFLYQLCQCPKDYSSLFGKIKIE